jgi:glycosyltransferase involved in cell wall biosynthesis
MKTIGIGLPVRNGEEYLEAALTSCLKQSSPPDEILVLINNSCDRSLEIARRLGDKIRVVESNAATGIGDAWNEVYKNARTDYVVMLHQDDILDENAIAHFRKKIESSPSVEFIIGLTSLINESGADMGCYVTREKLVMLEQDYLTSVLGDILFGCSGVCARRESMVLNPYRTDLKIILDIEFFIRVGWILKHETISQNVACFRQHDKSTYHSDAGEVIFNDFVHWWKLHESKKLVVPVSLENAYSHKILKMCSRDFLKSLKSNNRNIALSWVRFFFDNSLLKKARALRAISGPSEILIRIGAVPGLGFFLSRLLLKTMEICLSARRCCAARVFGSNLFHLRCSSRS